MKATLSEKGQVTIPQSIRDQLGLKPGQVLDFEAKDGVLIAKKQLNPAGLDEVTGILSKKIKKVDSYLEGTRGPAKKRGGE